VFKILTEMCSSLAEAHAQGIVHRDLKPENVYLESRPGNPEFVKILDFGIAKVMRGDSIDPQAPQLTATGQTLGTLEYMSPEQLMGKQLDGRSDVYALGVVAYEMITGQLPFPDARGPAGLITAQLKQTPKAPSTANPKVHLPPTADRVILKALEKDKANRFADVTAMAAALQEVLDHAREHSKPLATPVPNTGSSTSLPMSSGAELLETRRGDPPLVIPPKMPPPQVVVAPPAGPPVNPVPLDVRIQGGGPPQHGYPQAQSNHAVDHVGPIMTYPQAQPNPMYPSAPQAGASSKWVWWVVGLLALGAAAGAVLALVMR
jgi:serine/threonine protein kinase